MKTLKVNLTKALKGEIKAPGDKSISHRAVMIGGISEGKTRITGFLTAEDTINSARAMLNLGVDIEGIGTESIIVNGKGLLGLREPENVLDLGNSGTGIRLLTGLLAGQGFFSVLTGDSSLRKRPMGRVIKPLKMMGADISGRENDINAPVAIKGTKLKGIDYNSPISSAQVKSSLLLAGLYAEGETKITEPMKSRDHTERMLRYLGAEIKEKGLSVSIKGGQRLKGAELKIPGDISSAAFFMVAASVVEGSDVIIRDTGINSTRTGIIDILKMMGADIEILNKRDFGLEPVADIRIRYSPLKGAVISGGLVPRAIDEFPILCVAGALADGETVIRDAKELRVKESDRIAAMADGLRRMGVDIEEFDDGLRIAGRERLSGAVCKSYCDHRVAMALIIAGLRADGETIIEDTEWINTSFPDFMEKLNLLKR
ncbi:MAG: 3-phosphoshikimate 1-carboxyvinyltransferase [Nitrospirae bacterium]|nr:3-phosphoshikimate 1-carboxyvinyltransferase [Nitrospirota bacterium]